MSNIGLIEIITFDGELPLAIFCFVSTKIFQNSFAYFAIQWKTIVHGHKSASLTFKVWRVCNIQLKDIKPFTCSLDNVVRTLREIPPKIGSQRAR